MKILPFEPFLEAFSVRSGFIRSTQILSLQTVEGFGVDRVECVGEMYAHPLARYARIGAREHDLVVGYTRLANLRERSSG